MDPSAAIRQVSLRRVRGQETVHKMGHTGRRQGEEILQEESREEGRRVKKRKGGEGMGEKTRGG